MKKLLLVLPILLLITSCQDDEQISEVEKPETPEKPTKPENPTAADSTVYVYNNVFENMPLKYFKGPKGKEYSDEAKTYLKSIWSSYNDPQIKKVTIKKDSIFIQETNIVSKYKFKLDQNDIIADNNSSLKLGKLESDKQITIYKNFVSYYVVNADRGESFSGKSSDLGFILDKNIYPRIITSPTDLKTNNEYLFYGNVGYKFNKQ